MATQFHLKRGWASIPFTAAATLAAGDPVSFTSFIGVVEEPAVSGDLCNAVTQGYAEGVACLSTDEIAIGDALFWDVSNSRLTKTVSSHPYAGRATSASPNGTATVNLLLGHMAPDDTDT